jgi:eukaryotic-like serine/threonine-protein kinase
MAALGRLVRTLPGPEDRGPASVRDIDGNAMELDARPIGRGGQGTVYRIRQTRYAVKLSDESQAAGPGDGLADRLARLHWLPLEGLPVSRPLRPLAEPHVGYTMDLLDDMEPMAALCEPPDGEMEPWYLAGGGLRRRLRLLARCAGILGILHGRGLVYCDVSPGNVLASADPQHNHVWLIDPDNIAIESSARKRVVQTRLYRAPEIARRQSGNTPFSDLYSFAILAYQTLRGDHPLLGDLVDESQQREEDVERGLLPWTGHSTDARNRSSYGLPAETVLTTRLADMFRQNFETGLNDPILRPSADAWAAALSAAADVTLTCRAPECGHSYYAFGPHCPFCGAARPDMIVVGVREQVPGHFGLHGAEPVIFDEASWIVLQAGEPFLVTERYAQLVAHDPDQPVLRLRWRGDETVDVENVGSAPVRRVPPTGGTGRTLLPGALASERIEAGWRVHFDDNRRIHRLLTFHKLQRQGA